MEQEYNELRKTVKKLLVEHELDRASHALLPKISAKLGRPVHNSTYHMALTGYRSGPASQEILVAVRDILSTG